MEYIVKLDEDITYHLSKKRIRNMYIRVKDKEVFVTAPLLMSSFKIHKFIEENKDKIMKMINKKEKKTKELTLLGKETNEEEFKEFIDLKALLYVKDRVSYYYSLMDLRKKIPEVKVKNIKSSYGVYHSKNHYITFNTEIFKYREEVIDYVVVHELSHIEYLDHSKSFWNYVSKYCPNYKSLRKELKGK